MNPIVQPVVSLLTGLTVATDAGIVLLLLASIAGLVIPWASRFRHTVMQNIRPYARPLAFLVALTAMLGSLFYSEVAKYTPCLLCWYQRILMYPQTLLIAMGIIKKDKDVADYVIGFSVVGGIIALYHYIEQVHGSDIIPCSAVGYSASCSNRFTLEYGYITIPMMALTAFVAIIILMLISKTRAAK